MIFVSFQGYFDIEIKNRDYDIRYSPATFRHNFSLQVYAASFQWRLLIYIGKNLWLRVLEANKKQAPLKSYSPKMRAHFVNQVLKNKEKVTSTYHINIPTRVIGWKIPCVCLCLLNNKKSMTCRYISLRHTDNGKYFSGLFLSWNRKKGHMFHLAREVGKIWRCSCWEKGHFIIISELRYGQTWKTWPSPLSLSLYLGSTLEDYLFSSKMCEIVLTKKNSVQNGVSRLPNLS